MCYNLLGIVYLTCIITFKHGYLLSECIGKSHFISLCFPVLHRCCIFHKLKAKPPTNVKITTHLIVVVWDWTHSIFEVSLQIYNLNEDYRDTTTKTPKINSSLTNQTSIRLKNKILIYLDWIQSLYTFN